MEPTHDTPQERDEKAALIAAKLRVFRWEVRFWFSLAIVAFFLD